MSFKKGDIVGTNQTTCVAYEVVEVSSRTGRPTALKSIGIFKNNILDRFESFSRAQLETTSNPDGWNIEFYHLKEMTQIDLISIKVKQMYKRRKEQGYAF